jgi:photosystem II stability/assembly factor-like uncharacterized protein
LNGFALCEGGVYRTINGGYTWGVLENTKSNVIVPFNLSVGSPLSFCYTSGDTVYFSKDGGNTISKYTGDYFIDCYFIDENIVLLNGVKNLWLLKDRGANLVPQFKNDSIFRTDAILAYKTITKLNESRFWVARPSGNLYETKDKGLTWSKLDLKYNKLTTIQMLSDDLGFYTDQSGIKRTINGGIFWKSLNFTSTDLHFFNENIGYVSDDIAVQSNSGNSRVYYTKDGGLNWTEVFSLKNASIIEMFFLNEKNGWLSTSQGIYKYVGS